MHPLNAHLAELSESSVILSLLPKLTEEFYLCALLALAQCPLGRASHNPQQNSVCNCVFSHIALPPRCSATLRSSSRVVDSNSYVVAHLCMNPQYSEMHPLCTAIRTRSVLSHPPGVKPQRSSPEIKTTCNYLAHIHNI
jgi:hypothetical protein